jgi:hypothetical protein
MSNIASLVPFKKGDDPRRKGNGRKKGSFSLTTAVKEFLLENAKDGETYGEKLKKAAVLRAISKSDPLMKEIWERMDGKVADKLEASMKVQKIEEVAEATKKLLESDAIS